MAAALIHSTNRCGRVSKWHVQGDEISPRLKCTRHRQVHGSAHEKERQGGEYLFGRGTMSCLGFRNPTHRLRFVLGCFLVCAGTELCLMNGAIWAQAGSPTMGGPATQNTDMDHHEHSVGAMESMTPHEQHTGPHMKWTALRPANAADVLRGEQIVHFLRSALAKYKDYRVAMDEGFAPLHPERKPRHYHFVNKQHRRMARFRFDPAEPSALLYKKTGDGYELEGAMYTAPKWLSEDQLNERVPLSVAQWHAHIKMCFAPDGSNIRRLSRGQFGFKGTIVTESECQAAGGRFAPQVGGWMMHVYPFKATPAEIWTH